MRFRLQPTPAQDAALLEHRSHARFVWNLAVEQHRHWRPGRASAPGHVEQSGQLTEARKAFGWLAAGSHTVHQRALRDFAQPMANFFAGTHRRPTWRKAGVHEGFRIVGQRGDHRDVRRLARETEASQTDRRRDWVEQTSTHLARRYDLIRVEDLEPGPRTANLNLCSPLLRAGWNPPPSGREDVNTLAS
jgi:hypothetical protein